jgi:hypothetical protein
VLIFPRSDISSCHSPPNLISTSHTQSITIMADPELAALRAARLNQLQQSADANGANGQSGAGSSEEAEKRRAEEQMKRDLLATALEPAARERRTSHCLLISLILATGMDLANLQCPVLRSCRLRGRVRSSPSSCECYKLDISGGVSASNSSLIYSNRYVLLTPPWCFRRYVS